MGRRGPLPKPTAQKRLEGNPGRRPLPINEPEPDLLDTVPRAPSHLSPIAADAWYAIAKELMAAKMLASLDLQILEMACVAYSQWRSMILAIEKEGYVYRTYTDEGDLKFAAQTPEATLCSKFAADFNRGAKVLGLGPAYRVGLQIGDTGSGSTATRDPIAKLFAGSGSGFGPRDAPQPPKSKALAKHTSKKAAKKKVTKKKATKKATKKRAPKRQTKKG